MDRMILNALQELKKDSFFECFTDEEISSMIEELLDDEDEAEGEYYER